MTQRTFVPFESLWQMRIDVPYSLLVRDGDYAWSCGQLALDGDSNVLAADDLETQSSLVAGYINEVLERAELNADHLRRLLLYYVPVADGTDLERVAAMRASFRAALGDGVLFDVVPVPHFYYDGIVLEVDAFVGPAVDDVFEWVSVEVHPDKLADTVNGIDPSSVFSAHWFAPATQTSAVGTELERLGLVHDAGAVVSAGDHTDLVRGSLLCLADGNVSSDSATMGDVRVTSKTAGDFGWVAARSLDRTNGLVEQTQDIMEAVAVALSDCGVGFDAVVKSTTLYVGGSSETELHDNMSVRNRRYAKPGPASTGLPIYGLSDPASKLTVDVVYRRP